MRKNLLFTLAGAVAMAALVQAQAPIATSTAKEASPRSAVPVEPIVAIVETFHSHSIVAIGNVEFYGNEQCHGFQVSLVRNPVFATLVNDIVVEFGNARYQDVIDRFVRGEDVPYESLRQVWQDTTQVEYIWDLPIYEDFFRAVRTVNASLPRARQLRVLLGDPPIDWDKVHTAEDLRKSIGDRDGYAVDVLRREVLAKGHRALVIYGSEHLVRKNSVPGAASEWANGVVARLEKDNVTSVFTIHPETRRDLKALQSDVATWPTPSLAVLRGTSLGAAIWDPDPQRRPVRMEDQFDAVLYLGPPSTMTMSKLSPALCADGGYMEMQLRRLSLIPPPPGAPFNPADQLKDYCEHPESNAPVTDSKPEITEMIRQALRDAAEGKVEPAHIAPESRDRLVPFLQDIGRRFLAPAGALESLTLLLDANERGRHVRRYRTVFASGRRIIWNVGLSPAGTIVSLEPRPE